MTTPPKSKLQAKRIIGLVGIVCMILGPFWGYLTMFICKTTQGGQIFDTITFYMMLIGWMVAPIGILLLLYNLATRTIIKQRQQREIK